MANPRIYARLLEELRSVMPQPSSDITFSELEQLPYLTAVILEGLRIASAFSHRQTRLFPKVMKYRDYDIPPGTIICMTSLLLNYHEDVFPEPYSFKPERWLGDNRTQLQYYLTSFSKGPRVCVGMNLAWAELYLCLAMVFRRFRFDLSSVSRKRDIDIDRDIIFSMTAKESQGMIVKVLSVED